MSSSNRYIVNWQRVEGALVLSASLAAYFEASGNLLMLVMLILVFDISMLGYLRGPKLGAFIYNLGHNFGSPLTLLVIAFVADDTFLAQLGYIWLAHIGLDRLFGYGLKAEQGFKHTHLGKIG